MDRSAIYEVHPNLDSAISGAILESEIEGGVSLNQVPVGTKFEVQTKNTLYHIENRGDGQVLISGHPKFCPEPVLVDFQGSTWGTPMCKLRFIGRGMFMEFRHPAYGMITTTRVIAVTEVQLPRSFRGGGPSSPCPCPRPERRPA